VSGDNVLEHFTGENFITANAYLGAKPCVDALKLGADIVITGRVADPSLTVAAAMFEFEWSDTDWNRLAAATVAGHLIECGPQLTGGIATHWLELPDPSQIEYPIIEIDKDGIFLIKGHYASLRSVKEQLLYEIGDPYNYLSPDVTVSLHDIKLTETPEGIKITDVVGKPATATYKVSTTTRAGFKCEGSLVIVGKDAAAKARKSGEILLKRIQPEKSCVEVIGSGDILPGVLPRNEQLTEVVLRVAAADKDAKKLERFARQFAPFVIGGPPGITGYSTGRPKVRPQFGYQSRLVDKAVVNGKGELLQ